MDIAVASGKKGIIADMEAGNKKPAGLHAAGFDFTGH
jgi:hypothetical protein